MLVDAFAFGQTCIHTYPFRLHLHSTRYLIIVHNNWPMYVIILRIKLEEEMSRKERPG